MILSLDNSDQVEFALSQSNIKAVLAGETIQVSHRGIFCKLTRSGSIIHVYFAWKTRHEHVTCSADDLELLVGVADQQQLEA